MSELLSWPGALPAPLHGLPARVGEQLGASSRDVGELAELAGAPGSPAIVVLNAASAGAPGLFDELDRVVAARTAPMAIVVGDGWIGTEGPDLASAVAGAGAVALARSIAVRRRPTARINIVTVPERLVGEAGSQRGPLALDITIDEVADVAAFVLSDAASYIDGQVLYANGGRQLFSSLTA